jgi:hypothetical protein
MKLRRSRNDVSGLVGKLRGEKHRDLDKSGVNPRHKTRRHIKRRQLVLCQKSHNLNERDFQSLGQWRDFGPWDVCRCVPLRAYCLVVELCHFQRRDLLALVKCKGISGTARYLPFQFIDIFSNGYRVDHHVRAMKRTCIGARSHSEVAGLPPKVAPLRAACTLAGNTTMKKTIRAILAACRREGIVRPTAPSNSQTPVK